MDEHAIFTALDDHLKTVEVLRGQASLLLRIADAIAGRVRQGGCIYILGNGGSAADAQHIAGELVGRFKRDRRPFPAVALTTDTSILTAVVNDLGPEHMFARQVEALVRHEDVLWALSVSGASTNVLRAVDHAAKVGALRIGFTGRSGHALAERCDFCLMVPHHSADRVQETHELAYHLVCEQLEEILG